MRSTTDTAAIGRAIAAFGIESSGLRLPRAVLSDAEWTAILDYTKRHRIAGHLADAVSAGAMPATAHQRGQAEALHRSFMAGSVRLEAMLVDVIHLLADASLDHRVLKGCAAGHLDYADPAQRCFGDADILVRPEHLDQAIELLKDHGFDRRYPQPRPGFDRRFGKSVALVSPDHLELDVHRSLAAGPFGIALSVEDLWGSHEAYCIGATRLLALSRENRLLHACYHSALGDPEPRLVALRDVLQLLLGDTPIDLRAVSASATTWQGKPVVHRALRLATEVFALESGSAVDELMKQVVPSPGTKRLLNAYTNPRAGYATRAWSGVRMIRGARYKGAYIWALAFPSRRYVQGRHRSWRHRWLKGAREIVGSRANR